MRDVAEILEQNGAARSAPFDYRSPSSGRGVDEIRPLDASRLSAARAWFWSLCSMGKPNMFCSDSSTNGRNANR